MSGSAITLEIKNFQSIEHSTIVIDGFTSLVGRSNIGKSAIVRAVKAALTGAPAEGFVRHGGSCLRLSKGSKTCKCYCSVHLKSNNFDLLWEKGDAVNSYVFNGQSFTDTGRGTPDFLLPAFEPVKIGSSKELLQVSDQFSPIFLLDQKGGAIADVLSDVARLDQINEAIRLSEKDRKEVSSTRKLREKDISELETKLEGFDGLDLVAKKILNIQTDEIKITTATDHVVQIFKYKTALHSLVLRIKALEQVSSIIIPELDQVTHLYTKVLRCYKLLSSFTDREKSVNNLSGVEILSIPEFDGLHKSFSRFNNLNFWLIKLRSIKEFMAKTQVYESVSIPDINPLKDGLAKLNSLSEQIVTSNLLVAKSSALEKAIQKLDTLEQKSLEEELAVKKESDALGACPMCLRPIIQAHNHTQTQMLARQ